MKTRYRTQEIGWFNKQTVLVLQIWKTWPDGPDDFRGMPIYLAGKGWRDATPEDLINKEFDE